MTPEERLRRHRSAASGMNGEEEQAGLMRRPSVATAVSGKSSTTMMPAPVEDAEESTASTIKPTVSQDTTSNLEPNLSTELHKVESEVKPSPAVAAE